MSNLKIFKSEEFGTVRVILRDEEPWFVAKDVATILGYSETSVMLRRLDDDEKIKIEPTFIAGSNSMARKITIINESGLYSAILGSKKPFAKQFRKWITSEVLPTMRKTGGYIVENRAIDFVNNWLPSLDDISKNAIASVLEENRKLVIENKEMKPKANYFDALVDKNLLTNFRDTAKEFKIGQKELISWLLDNKYIYRDKKGKLKPYNDKVEKGLFELKEFVKGDYTDVQTLITPRGRETFRLLLECR